MKKLFLLIAAAMLTVMAATDARAILITPDVVNLNGVYLNGSDNSSNNNSVSFTHNILDNGFAIGDTLNWARINFAINDNEGNDDSSFYVFGWCWWDYTDDVSLLTDGVSRTFEIDNGSSVNLNVTALARLQADGILNVTLTSTYGDFYLYTSTLTADYNDNTTNTPVPEPATLLLIGSGLLGLTGLRRKSR